jgi:uncharacterized membrane protein YfcA
MILPGLDQLLPLALMLAGIGAFAGIIAGMLGVGGGIVLVPAFLYAFTTLGYDGPRIMQICLATSLATIVVTSARSVRAHAARGAVDAALLRGWAPSVMVGAILGVAVAGALRTPALMAIFGVLGLMLGLFMAFGREDWRLGTTLPDGPFRAVSGVGLGLLSVLMGIGGGVFGVTLMRLHGVAMHRAVGTASGFGLVIALPAVAGFLATGWSAPNKPPLTVGLVNLPAFTIVVAMTLLTTPIGVRIAHATEARRLKRLFALFIIVMALNMLRKALGG